MRKADVYICEKRHEFAIIQKTDVDPHIERVLPCPFHREIAYYKGTIDVELRPTPKQREEGWN